MRLVAQCAPPTRISDAPGAAPAKVGLQAAGHVPPPRTAMQSPKLRACSVLMSHPAEARRHARSCKNQGQHSLPSPTLAKPACYTAGRARAPLMQPRPARRCRCMQRVRALYALLAPLRSALADCTLDSLRSLVSWGRGGGGGPRRRKRVRERQPSAVGRETRVCPR